MSANMVWLSASKSDLRIKNRVNASKMSDSQKCNGEKIRIS